MIVHLNVMAIEEENVHHDLNLEIEQQLMVNNSMKRKKERKKEKKQNQFS